MSILFFKQIDLFLFAKLFLNLFTFLLRMLFLACAALNPTQACRGWTLTVSLRPRPNKHHAPALEVIQATWTTIKRSFRRSDDRSENLTTPRPGASERASDGPFPFDLSGRAKPKPKPKPKLRSGRANLGPRARALKARLAVCFDLVI